MNNFNSFKKSFGFLSAVVLSVTAMSCSNNIKENSTSSVDDTSAMETTTENVKVTTETEIANADPPPKKITYEYAKVFSKSDLNPTFEDITAEVRLNGSSAECDNVGISIDGSTITITEEGIYRFSGTLNDGQVIVNAPDAKVQIILDNADITCSTSSAVYGVNSKKIFISLAENSINNLTDGKNYTDKTNQEPDACVFSKDSLTINGNGTLNINSSFDGIHGKDDVVITGGNINITSDGDGIKGKDYVAVADGNISINSGGDGVKSTNTTDTSLGYVYIQNGGFTINSTQDGIQAERDLIILDGNFDITSGGGSENATKTHLNDFDGRKFNDNFSPKDFGDMMPPDNFNPPDFNNTPTQDTTTETTVSTKGIKGGSSVNIIGGEFTVNSADDAVHSANVAISGDNLNISAGNKGIHADSHIYIDGGNVNIKNSYEGIEGSVININGGNIKVKSSDDGFNASDGTTNQDGMGTYSDGVALNIKDGSVYVNADGDGLDSNGNITISGGNVIIDGCTNGGNGALDSNNEIIVTGGTLIAVGSSQMAECPDNSSTQYTVSATFENIQQAGTSVKLLDESGSEIINFTSAKTFDNIIISSPDILKDKTYTFYLDNTKSESFTASEIISKIGRQSDFGGGHGKFKPANENSEFEMPERKFDGMHRNSDTNL